MAIFGLQADVAANPNQQVNLYTPGKTQLTAQDVFLGGEGTGVGDAALNGATRIFGDDRAGTARALTDYNQDISSKIRSAQTLNDSPRVDAAMGTPTAARLSMEQGQGQGKVESNLARDAYNQRVYQDNFTNEVDIGNMMGSYKGSPTMAQKQHTFVNGVTIADLMGSYNGQETLAQKVQRIKSAQFNAEFNQKGSQFDRELSSSDANKSADRATKVSGDVNSWLTEALKATGQDLSNLPYLATIVQHESSGNPTAINEWDSNWKAGHPSKGLMQTIDSTFNQYKLPGHSDIWNPIDNAIAAIRYSISRYGSVGNVPGIKSLKNGGGYIGY